MLDYWFTFRSAIKRHRDGLLGPYVDAFATRLREEGYARGTAQYQIQLISAFGRWLSRRGLKICSLHDEIIEKFLRYRWRRGQWVSGDRAPLMRLLRQLQSDGLVPTRRPAAVESHLDLIGNAYREYLDKDRQLERCTQAYYIPYVHSFLSERYGTTKPRLAQLTANDVIRFIQRHVHDCCRGRAKHMVTALRSFFRFLRLRGDIRVDLAACVPTIPDWRMTGLPQALQSHEVKKLLNTCDRSTGVGRRNYAILLLLARLGLRAGEVVNLTFEDIDWEAGEIKVSGKNRRPNLLPLPDDVGRALANYLRRGRPRCSTRRVFVRAKAPYAGFVNSRAITTIVSRAIKRAGLNPPHRGAHLLRHTLATHLLRRGALLSEIGEVLGHRDPDTTSIYAKVDLARLRTLVCRWPGGAR
jgi:site-specific recombinase XerD